MTCDEHRELESARRKALWALASLSPGDQNASELLATLDELDKLDLKATSSTQKPLDLDEVRDSATVQHHHSGIDIILERTIQQPWRERFHQASIGSTRLLDGPYAVDWYKFLACWESEMQHLDAHRAACIKAKLD